MLAHLARGYSQIRFDLLVGILLIHTGHLGQQAFNARQHIV